jgi:hypothetical protein
MTQAPLDCTGPLRPIAAHTDPDTSHQAARHLARTGQLGRSMRATLTALAAWRGAPPTSYELAGDDLRARFEHGRRLPDLRERGLVTNGAARPCRVTGRQAVTWVVTAAGHAALGGQA